MSKRAYFILSAICIGGAVLLANVAILANLSSDELSFASVAFTALLGLGGTLGGRGRNK